VYNPVAGVALPSFDVLSSRLQEASPCCQWLTMHSEPPSFSQTLLAHSQKALYYHTSKLTTHCTSSTFLVLNFPVFRSTT
jgi:hypothetical protein